ncbi:hypothetical protein [Amphritea sp.]|uniref:hypothetical protein n=1 Tax=Amphritea sp. TaxID=1872502 RepID=UPI003A8EF5DD
MKRFILHLGFHKTATSSIQRTLSSNKDLLDELGFFYPIFFRGSRCIINHSIPFYSVYSEKPELYHVNIRNGDSQNIVSVNEEYSSKIDEVLDCNKNVIISGEDISILSKSALENIKCKIQEKGFSLEVYCFVRRPYSFTCSALQERIKNGTAVLDDIRVASKAVDVLKLKSVFGKGVHFFSFENVCIAQEPVVFFIEMLGIESSQFSIVNSNEGLGNLSTRILAHLNVTYPIIKDGNFYVKGRRFFDKSIDNEKFFLTGDEVDKIRPALIKENKRLFDILGKDFTDDEFLSSKNLNIDFNSAVKIYSTYKESHTSLALLQFIKENSKFNISCMCDYFSRDPDFRRDFSMIYEKDDSCFSLGCIKDSKKTRNQGSYINRKISECINFFKKC